MHYVLFHLTTVASLAVLVVLVYGLWTMLKGRNANLSQKLMRWRIGLQFVAIVVVMGFALLTRG
ncbi:MAG: twin transmembrane helix small protein [Pseudomonadota bacterium]